MKPTGLVAGALQGKTIGRLLLNSALAPVLSTLRGKVLDIAGGKQPSYLSFVSPEAELIRTNVTGGAGVMALDFNKPLPFQDAAFSASLLINALYIAEDPARLAAEVFRTLVPGGMWVVASPFIANEMPEPHDYRRFTAEGLERLCEEAGFIDITISRIGERASAAAQLLQPFFLFNVVRAIVFPIASFFDRLVPQQVRRDHPAPIAYLVQCRKPA